MSTGPPSAEQTIAGDLTVDEDTLGAAAVPVPPLPSPQRGTSIGRYVVLERIGRGGMGIVFAAYDPQLDRKVALKLLIPRNTHGDAETGQQRLMREAQAMARVSHPHVVAVHDVGLHQGQVFMAMEFIEGPTLRQWLKAEPREPRQVLQVFAQAGRGLAAAHAKGLVHRDFKPDNVMVGHDDAEDQPRVRVMDFGLVRALEADELDEDDEAAGDTTASALPLDPTTLPASDQTLTQLGQLLGTPAFMSPEQFIHQPVDARTDQFSFCVALWSALYGQEPFEGQSVPERASRVLSGELTRPPASSSVSPRLRRILERGLSVDREQRWPSMDTLLTELLRDPSRGRRRVMLGTGAVAVAGAIVLAQQALHRRAVQACEREAASIDEIWSDEARALVRRGWSRLGEEQAEAGYARLVPWIDHYADDWRHAKNTVCLAAEVEGRWDETTAAIADDCLAQQREELRVYIESMADPDRGILDNAISAIAGKTTSGQCIDEGYLALQPPPLRDPERLAEHKALQTPLARIARLTQAGHGDEALVLLEEVRPRVEALGHGPDQLTLLAHEANAYRDAGRHEEATDCFYRSFSLALELGATDRAAGLAVGLAASHMRNRELDDARWATQLSAALFRRSGQGDDDLLMHQVVKLRSWIERNAGNFDRALEHAEQALAIAERALGADHPNLSEDLCLVASILGTRNELDRAEAMARRCVQLRENALGPWHAMLARGLQILAEVRLKQGARDEAVEAFERALSILETQREPDDILVGTAQGNLGMALNEAGHFVRAETLLEQSVRTTVATYGPRNYNVGLMLTNLGNARQSQGKHDAACESYRHALEILDADPEANRVARGVVLINLGNSEFQLGQLDEALDHHRSGIAILETTFGPQSPQMVHALGNLGTSYYGLGQHDEALEVFERTLELGERVLGPEHVDQGYALVGMAQTLLALGRGAEALPLAERALALRQTHEALPHELAVARWRVAQALDATGQQPERARSLAQQARPEIGKAEAGAIESFLATR